MIHMTFERGGPKFANTTARALAWRTAASVESKMATMQHKIFGLILIESIFLNHAVLIRRLVYVTLKTSEWTKITKSISYSEWCYS
jgi:hypothetical protein